MLHIDYILRRICGVFAAYLLTIHIICGTFGRKGALMPAMSEKGDKLQLVLQEGEGQTIEFKAGPAKLDREMVAFANALGGSIFLGIDDHNKIVGIDYTNKTISQIQDIARNCDPPVSIHCEKHPRVLEIVVKEGTNKPYRCQGGFYLRIGPNAQKLTRDEIINFAVGEGKIRFDEQINPAFSYKDDFLPGSYALFKDLSRISTDFSPEEVLINLNVAEKQKGQVLFTNAAVLFFARDPQKFFPEASITAIRYRGLDRDAIIDRKDMRGGLIDQVNDAINFTKRHTEEAFIIRDAPRHEALSEYPTAAVREAVVNAVMHRDYFYDSSHIYMHIFSDRMEIENPGGLFKGLTLEDLGRRSVRRNRLIAELFFRAGFIEMIGSGITRMFKAMEQNGNPKPEIRATNFFNIVFKKRVLSGSEISLTDRQKHLLHFLQTRGTASKSDCSQFLNVSGDTALRELKTLIEKKLIRQAGRGKATLYSVSLIGG